VSRPRIIARHVLPRIAGPVIVQASLLAAAVLLVQTGLSFLGLLVPAPAPSWGGMVADGAHALELQPWLIWPPGLVIALTILAFGQLGDAVRDATTEGWAARPGFLERKATTQVPAPLATRPEPARRSLLSVQSLTVCFQSPAGRARVIEDVTFAIEEGEVVGIVGESGCGKTVTAMSILGLLPENGDIEGGSVVFDGRSLTAMSEHELRLVRGREIALISQEPMVSLNPVLRVGWQVTEAVRQHVGLAGRAARVKALDLLEAARLPDPEQIARRYPHELSGGMAQRVAIARALAGEPRLLIADEPTTALDVTVQAEILDLLRALQRDRGMAVLFITHDWGVVADICDRAVVMYAGQVVERGPLLPIIREPRHPYTRALLASNPHRAKSSGLLPTIPGSVPPPGSWPAGCHFHTRCPLAESACREGPIQLQELPSGRETRCIRNEQLALAIELRSHA
jgi:peptide/nickel transport system permease protein